MAVSLSPPYCRACFFIVTASDFTPSFPSAFGYPRTLGCRLPPSPSLIMVSIHSASHSHTCSILALPSAASDPSAEQRSDLAPLARSSAFMYMRYRVLPLTYGHSCRRLQSRRRRCYCPIGHYHSYAPSDLLPSIPFDSRHACFARASLPVASILRMLQSLLARLLTTPLLPSRDMPYREADH